jgi:hypothetical protein
VTRSADREGFDLPGRVRLIEGDLDKSDEFFGALRDEIHAVRAILTGVLIAVTTTAIMLAVNLVVGTGK